MEFVEAIKRPFTDIKSWLIGCVLMIIPIVNFLSIGYSLEAAKLSLKNKKEMPVWDKWGNLFLQGLLVTVISLIYMIPAMILMLVGGITLFGAVLAGGANLAALGPSLAASSVPFLIGALLLVIGWYLLPAAALGYAAKGKFGDAFDFSKIFKKAFTGPYLGAWVISVVIAIVLGFILNWIFIVGPAVAQFTSMIMSITLVAEAYRKA